MHDGLSFTTRAFEGAEAVRGTHARLKCLLLYAYVVLIACPIRYWPLEDGVDPTWRFALNYAADQGLTDANDRVFTMGPLSFLLFPQNAGSNLTGGLLFQIGLWAVLGIVFADLFFRARLPLNNLVMFTACFALTTPMFWFAAMGTETLMLGAPLILIVLFRLRGSVLRLASALVLIGFLPMFKLTGAMVGFTALGGFLVDRIIHRRWSAAPEAMAALAVPLTVSTVAGLWVMPSGKSYLNYLIGSGEIIKGYSVAMSLESPGGALFWALQATVVLTVLLGLQTATAPAAARFNFLFLALPLFLSFKHGFVREDEHVINFFCFAAMAAALGSLTLDITKVRVSRVLPLGVLFGFIWFMNVRSALTPDVFSLVTGKRALRVTWRAMSLGQLIHQLEVAEAKFPDQSRLEPELVELIGDAPVASLSHNFTNLAAAHLRIELYPVIQRYAAYTPYLDEVNAAWIRERGPKFLVFDGHSIDGRDPWAETPSMFLEIYRWYDARLLGPRNLLLERRTQPRFSALKTVSRFQVTFPPHFSLPTSRIPVFWRMKCGYSPRGQLLKALFRVPPFYMSTQQSGGKTRSARVIADVLVAPVLGNHLPDNLVEFEALFRPDGDPEFTVEHFGFNTSKPWAYEQACEVEFLSPVQQ